MNTLAYILLTLALLPLYYLLVPHPQPHEPPSVHGPIPYLSNLLHLTHHGPAFYWDLTQQHPTLPIFTLPGPTWGTKAYIVTSPDVVQHLRRHATQFLEPNPFVKFAARRYVGVSAAALAEFDGGRADGRPGLTAELIRADDRGLLGREGLRELNVRYAEEVAAAGVPEG